MRFVIAEPPPALDPAAPPPACIAVAPPATAGEPLVALACDGARWVFAQAGYCPEGVGRTGAAWLVDGAAVRTLDAVPECHSPVAALIADDVIWLATERPVEKHAPLAGTLSAVARDGTVTPVLRGENVTALATRDGRVAAASRSGIHEFDPADGRWVHRYFAYALSAAGDAVLTLADRPLTPEGYELWSIAASFPAVDARALVDAWDDAPPTTRWYAHAVSPPLAPVYRAAAREMLGRGWQEWTDSSRFAMLLELVAASDPTVAGRAALLADALDADIPAGARLRVLGALAELADDPAPAGVATPVDFAAVRAELAIRTLARDARERPDDESLQQLCDLVRADPSAAAAATTPPPPGRESIFDRCGTPGEPVVVLPRPVQRMPGAGKAIVVEYSELLDPASVRMSVNGVDVTARLDPRSAFRELVDLPLVDGQNLIEVEARDEDGAPFAASTTVGFGALTPTVSVERLQFGSKEEMEAFMECRRARIKAGDDPSSCRP